MITRRDIFIGAITGLVSTVLGCNVPQREPDTNPNPRYGYVNLSENKELCTPGLIIDEDRDGTPDYISRPVTGYSSPQYVLFVREGFKPKHFAYRVDSWTKTMSPEMLAEAKKAIDIQNSLRVLMQNYPTKK